MSNSPDRSFIEKQIEIETSPSQVWRVFTDPAATQLMGGEYVCDWKPGSSFGWKGASGKMHTRGTLLQFEPDHLLQHDLLSSADIPSVLSVITYTLEEREGKTLLHAREDFHYEITGEEYNDSLEGWEAALMAVKQTAEEL